MERMDLELAQRLKYVREHLGLSQKELAQALGVSQKAVSYWERGERSMPAIILRRLKESLGVNPDWLLTGEGEPFLKPQGGTVKKKTKLPM